MPKAIIFDVDGTLVDSVDQHAQSWQDSLRDFGHSVDLPAIRAQIGKGGDQLMPVFLSQATIKDSGSALEKHRADVFKTRFLPTVKPFPEVRSLFERIKRDGKVVVLASSAKDDELKVYKRIAEIEDLVDGSTTSEDAEKSKPYPDIFQAALKQLAHTDAIVVGDTPYDAQAAAKAGLKTVGLLSGGFAEQDLRAAGCIAIYRDPADLLRNYDSSPLA